MCELLTIAAALATTVLYFRQAHPSKALFATMLMFWGAALMWGVDCFMSFREGEGLLDLSREDTLLGGIILAAGFSLYGVLRFFESRRAVAGKPA